MGVLIVCKDALFDEENVFGKVQIKEPDVPAEPKTIADYPVQDGLQGLYDLGEDYGLVNENDLWSPINYAPTDAYYQPTDTPQFAGNCNIEENYVTFSGKGSDARMHTYLRIPLVAGATDGYDGHNGLTYVALFSVPGGTLKERPIIGNRTSSIPNLSLTNAHVFFARNGASVTNCVFGGDGAINSNAFVILAMTADANGFKVMRYKDGALDTVPLVVDGVKVNAYEGVVDAWSNLAIQIGGNSTSTNYADAHISLAAVHTGKLTDEQLEEVCEFVYDYGKNTKDLDIE